MHGLFENAIYGGRVDNIFDVRVLTSYLQKYFSDSLTVRPFLCENLMNHFKNNIQVTKQDFFSHMDLIVRLSCFFWEFVVIFSS